MSTPFQRAQLAYDNQEDPSMAGAEEPDLYTCTGCGWVMELKDTSPAKDFARKSDCCGKIATLS